MQMLPLTLMGLAAGEPAGQNQAPQGEANQPMTAEFALLVDSASLGLGVQGVAPQEAGTNEPNALSKALDLTEAAKDETADTVDLQGASDLLAAMAAPYLAVQILPVQATFALPQFGAAPAATQTEPVAAVSSASAAITFMPPYSGGTQQATAPVETKQTAPAPTFAAAMTQASPAGTQPASAPAANVEVDPMAVMLGLPTAAPAEAAAPEAGSESTPESPLPTETLEAAEVEAAEPQQTAVQTANPQIQAPKSTETSEPHEQIEGVASSVKDQSALSAHRTIDTPKGEKTSESAPAEKHAEQTEQTAKPAGTEAAPVEKAPQRPIIPPIFASAVASAVAAIGDAAAAESAPVQAVNAPAVPVQNEVPRAASVQANRTNLFQRLFTKVNKAFTGQTKGSDDAAETDESSILDFTKLEPAKTKVEAAQEDQEASQGSQFAPTTAPATTTDEAKRAEKAPELPADQRKEVASTAADHLSDILASKRSGRITVRLNPEELGTLVISVRHRGQDVSAEITASNESVRQSLQSSRGELAASLEQKGHSLSNLTIAAETPASQLDFGHGGRSSQETLTRQDFERSMRLAPTTSPALSSAPAKAAQPVSTPYGVNVLA